MEDFLLKTISCLWPWCESHIGYACELEENVRRLSVAMDELKEARDDLLRRVDEAEADPNEPKKRTNSVRGWLERVQINEDEVEEMLTRAHAEQLGRGGCLGGCCAPNNCWSNYKLGKSIAKKIPLVKELKDKRHFEEVTYQLSSPSVQDMNLDSTVGMKSMFDKVWRLVTSTDDKPVRNLGLYGQGGVGKTHLLQQINNEFNKISEYDQAVMFVEVSKTINYEAIQITIGKRLGLSDSLQRDGDESSRADKIFNKLKNKNFVLLLDDLWERVDLQRIGIPRPQGNSSKVIFTTRNEEVGGLMEANKMFKVDCLLWDEAWSLFQEKVGEDALTSFPRAHELAKDIAKECGGLPLALITIGRAMSTKMSVKEWKGAINTLRNSASKFPGMGDEILPRLKKSYDNLRKETIKCCFLYCALFPKDHVIKIDRLIDYWIAEGFLNRFDNNLDEARSHGRHVIETLKRSCLLESVENEETQVKMQNINRELALWIVNDCKSNNKMDKFLLASNVCERWKNAKGIFWMTPGDGSNNELENPPTTLNLLTLIVKGQDFDRILNFSILHQNFFQFTPSLRVLVMSFIKLTEFPTSICELHELQYLDLSGTNITELPVELSNLVKLKFLDLSFTTNLEKIPPNVIAKLSELQHLCLFFSSFMYWELEEKDGGIHFQELSRLNQLQDVGISINTSLALEKLMCNQKLRMICTSLTLGGWLNIKSVSLSSSSLLPSTIPKLFLENLISLKFLRIWNFLELEEIILFMNDDGESDTSLLLSYNKLESLYLHGLLRLNNIVWEKYYYMGAQPQHHVHVSPFGNLSEAVIMRCNALKHLTWLIYVENLEILDVQYCEGLETIIKLWNIGRGVFGKLKKLQMDSLPKLKSICRHALAFQSIKIIEVSECPELKKLPLDSGSNVNNTLKCIQGSREWWNELQWGDETIKSNFLPYHKLP